MPMSIKSFFDKKFMLSSISSLGATILFFGIAHVLDHVIKPLTSTLVAIFISAIVNFIVQFMILEPPGKGLSYSLLYKFPISHSIEMIITYYGCQYFFIRRERYIKYFPDSLKPQYNTIVRLLVLFLHFIFISYPNRRYWIFV